MLRQHNWARMSNLSLNVWTLYAEPRSYDGMYRQQQRSLRFVGVVIGVVMLQEGRANIRCFAARAALGPLSKSFSIFSLASRFILMIQN